jgi:hypothetical protein
MDDLAPADEEATAMTSIAPTSTSFAYIQCDIPEGQTLVEWRLELDAARRAERDARRTFRMPRLPRLPRLRPALGTS